MIDGQSPSLPSFVDAQEYTMAKSSRMIRLISVLDAYSDKQDDQSDLRPDQTVYYKVAWDEIEPGNIADVTIMTARQTGALRQENRGKFSRAQFKITETSDVDDIQSEQFVWCDTRLHAPGETVTPELTAIATDFGYNVLTEENIVRTLHSKVQDVNGYMELLNFMLERNIGSTPHLTRRASAQAYAIMNEGLQLPDIKLHDPTYQNALFNLIGFLNKVSPEETKKIHGVLLSKLLRFLPLRWGLLDTDPQEEDRRDASFQTLQAALEIGALPLESRITARILSQPGVYESRSMTDLLTSVLAGPEYSPFSKNVCRVERSAFAHNFIVATLDRRLRGYSGGQSNGVQQLESYLRGAQSKTNDKPPIKFGDITALAKSFMADAPQQEELLIPADDYMSSGPSSAAPHFKKILDGLRSDNPDLAREEEKDDKQCLEIVRIILEPVIDRTIGNKVLQASYWQALKDKQI